MRLAGADAVARATAAPINAPQRRRSARFVTRTHPLRSHLLTHWFEATIRPAPPPRFAGNRILGAPRMAGINLSAIVHLRKRANVGLNSKNRMKG